MIGSYIYIYNLMYIYVNFELSDNFQFLKFCKIFLANQKELKRLHIIIKGSWIFFLIFLG